MDNYWQQQRLKRSSISAGTSYSNANFGPSPGFNPSAGNMTHQFYQPYGHAGGNEALFLQQQLRLQLQLLQLLLNSPNNTVTERSSYYETHYPLYHCEWSQLTDVEVQNILVSTYREDSTNRLQVLHLFPNYSTNSTAHQSRSDEEVIEEDASDHSTATGSPNRGSRTSSLSSTSSSSDIVMEGIPPHRKLTGFNLYKVSEVNVNYPITNLQWDPSMATGQSSIERVATSAECLRLYEVETEMMSGESKLVEKLTLTNSRNKNFNQLPPLTSFDWNKVEPNEIITGSIDTTCTLWDLTKGTNSMAKTQLIAHDSEVFDVKFLHGSKYLFSSCGNDGSIRVFDLRSLEHSTIVYEPQLAGEGGSGAASAVSSAATATYTKPQPLLKLALSNTNVNHVLLIELNSNRVLVLDLRFPGVPVKILDHHQAAVNSIKWHPTKNHLLTLADDCQLFIYDLSNLESCRPLSTGSSQAPLLAASGSGDLPLFAYSEPLEINNLCWGKDGNWIGVVSGKGFQVVNVER